MFFCVIEGIDGSGKSTAAKGLAQWLEKDGTNEVVVSREPTFGQWGQKIRASFNGPPMDIHEELDLFMKDRREHVETLIKPSLSAGKCVVLDRYYHSNAAYQSFKASEHGMTHTTIAKANEEFAPEPDLLFILDLPLSQATDRIQLRDGNINRFETGAMLTHCQKVYRSFLDRPYARLIDASQPPEGVLLQICQAVLDFAGVEHRLRA